MVPGRPLYIDEVSYWIPDMAQLRRGMASSLGISLTSAERSRMERAVREYEDSIPAGATEIPAGDTSVGRAVSADEARDTGSRKTSEREDRDGRDSRKKTSDVRSEGEKQGGRDARPGRTDEITSSSDTGGRHASTRQSADEPTAQPAAPAPPAAAAQGASPARGQATAGKEE